MENLYQISKEEEKKPIKKCTLTDVIQNVEYFSKGLIDEPDVGII
jgi:hypothetical protein